MGAAPSLFNLLTRFGPRVACAFAMEAAFTPLFRLTGAGNLCECEDVGVGRGAYI